MRKKGLIPLIKFEKLLPVKPILALFMAALPLSLGLVSCSNQVKARQPVSYRYEPGRTALMANGMAFPPSNAPMAVRRAMAAGNRLQRMPYKWGGGHAQLVDSGYDCSGTVSYVLRAAGLTDGSMSSKENFKYGSPGMG